MLDSIKAHLTAQDQHRPDKSEDDATDQAGVLAGLRNFALNVLPTRHISVAGIRDRAFGSSSRKVPHTARLAPEGLNDGDIIEDDHSASQDVLRLGRRRSNSSPPELGQQSVRQRAMMMKDSAMLDLRARANAFNLPRLSSFHFSLPFSDTNPSTHTTDDAIDLFRKIPRDTDNSSLTSLEVESLATDMKAENNRLRGLIEGLPRLGIPGLNPPDQHFAGLSQETKDLNICVLGGYRGSILRSAEDRRMLWIPVKVGLGLRKVDLELPLDPEAEAEAIRTIVPDGMLSHIGPVDISRRLLKKLRDMEEKGYCKVHNYGYDWRLGGQFLSDELIEFLSTLKGKTIVVAHSLGGLITLHALNRRPDLFDGALFAGTPFGGCPNILGPFRYGDGVLLNRELLNARTNFSMRSSFILLPTHKRCFVDARTGREIPIDFFDPEAWKEYGFSPEVTKDHGATDVGESTDVNGMIASGGLGGPSMGTGSNNTDTNDDEVDNNKTDITNANPSTRTQKTRDTSAEGDPSRRLRALSYLTTTLKSTLKFKFELRYNPSLQPHYPPLALLRSSAMPTVRGCTVIGEAGIRAGDYSKFIFSPGDGVVTYVASDIRQLSEEEAGGVGTGPGMEDDGSGGGGGGFGDFLVKDVSCERGHIGLLGDVAAVEECLSALVVRAMSDERRDGVEEVARLSDEEATIKTVADHGRSATVGRGDIVETHALFSTAPPLVR